MTKRFRHHRRDENAAMSNSETLHILKFGYFQDRLLFYFDKTMKV